MVKDADSGPPYEITSEILHSIEEIGESIGSLNVTESAGIVPHLRRNNRVKTIQASLEIEGNTLKLDQITEMLTGKRILGKPREIKEVQNAFIAYEEMAHWTPHARKDLLAAHRLLMTGLVDDAGHFRSGNIGIQRGTDVIHIAPPSHRVPTLVKALLNWLKTTPEHPLVVSCVFHYEFEFIHPFQDGNGRMGRLWQSVILTHWKDLFSMLPVEGIIRDRQSTYYEALRRSDQAANSTVFVEFMLDSILASLKELKLESDPVSDLVSDPVKRLLVTLRNGPMGRSDLMERLHLSHRPSFRKNYLRPALDAGFIVMTRPDTPNAHNQKYLITETGKRLRRRLKREGHLES